MAKKWGGAGIQGLNMDQLDSIVLNLGKTKLGSDPRIINEFIRELAKQTIFIAKELINLQQQLIKKGVL